MTEPPFSQRDRPDFERLFGPDAPEPSIALAQELLDRLPDERRSDDEVERIVQRVLARLDHPAPPRRRPSLGRRGLVAAALLATLALAFGASFFFHQWGGRHSVRTLSYEEAFAVLFDGRRSLESRRVALARIHKGIHDALLQLEPLLQDPVLAADVARLRDRLRALAADPRRRDFGGVPDGVLAQLLPTASDSSRSADVRRRALRRLAESLARGVLAIRAARAEGEGMEGYVRIALTRIRDQLER